VATSPTSVRAAIVGAGLMGRWHAHAIHRSGSRVVAIVDRDAARAASLASSLPGRPAIADDVGYAIREHGIDVVHVCTPIVTHEAIAGAAIAGGAHALVEKPLAGDAATVERLHRMATEQGVLLCPVHQFLFQTGVMHASRQLDDLGAVRQFDVVACSAGADGGSDADRESVALAILPHGLALARRLLGAPLAASPWQVDQGRAGELRVAGIVAETSVMIAVSMRARPTENSLTVRCDRGTIRANLFHGYATIERGVPSRLEKIGRPFVGSALVFGAAAGNLVARATRGESAYPGLRELVRQFHSATSGQGASPIAVDESIDVARTRDIIAAARSRLAR
jgi:predicted dehydrogenase